MNFEFSVDYCFKGIMEFKEKYGDYNTVKKFDERVIKLSIPRLSYLFLKNVEGCNKKAHTKIIISSNESKLIYETAKIKGVNTSELAKAILTLKNPEWNYYYARDIKDAIVKDHEVVVFNSSDNLLKYYFARDVKDADKRKFGRAVVESGDPSMNFFYAKDIQDGLLQEHMEVVKKDKELYEKLLTILGIKKESTKEKQTQEMCKEARRVLRRLDYIVSE